jgi:hypothetical protein
MRSRWCWLSLVVGLAVGSLLVAQEAAPLKETPTKKTTKDSAAPDKNAASGVNAGDEKTPDDKTAKKDSKKSSSKATKTDKKKGIDLLEGKEEKKTKLVYGASFSGVLRIDANSQKEFIVQVQVPEPNPQGIYDLNAALANWERRKIEIVTREPNPASRAQQLAQLQADISINLPRLQANTIRYVTKDIKLRAADDLVVRTNILPLDYDDKGRPKKYTKKELEELRGDKSLPGLYKSEFEALRDGQVVMVYLAKGQASPVPKTKKDAKKGIVVLPPPENALRQTPEVVLIVILAEPKDR